MAHKDLHARGTHEPDIELHLYVHKIVPTPDTDILWVQDMADHMAAVVTIEEQYVDYMNILIEGVVNQFLIPLGLAVEWGLVEEGEFDE